MVDLKPTPPQRRPKSAQRRYGERLQASPAMSTKKSPWQGGLDHTCRNWMHSINHEIESFASTSLASEVVLKQVYTATGTTDSSGPNKQRTVVACAMLYHISQLFDRYKDLIRCLLRDIFPSIFIIPEGEGIASLWDSLVSSEVDFFKQRADFAIESFTRNQLYFDEYKKVVSQLKKKSVEQTAATMRRKRCLTTLNRSIELWQRSYLQRTFRSWRVITRLSTFLQRINKRRKVQLKKVLRSMHHKKLIVLQQRFISRLKAMVDSEQKIVQRENVRNMELSRAEKIGEIQEIIKVTKPMERRLSLWENWSKEVISGRQVRTDWESDDGDENDEFVLLQTEFDVNKKSILDAMRRKVNSEKEAPKISAHRDHPSDDDLLLVLTKVFSKYSIVYKQQSKGLHLTENEPNEVSYVLTGFDFIRLLVNSNINCDRSDLVALFVFASEGYGDESGLCVRPEGIHELFSHISTVVYPTEDPYVALRRLVVSDIGPNLTTCPPTTAFQSLMRTEEVISMAQQHGNRIFKYFQEQVSNLRISEIISYMTSLSLSGVSDSSLTEIANHLSLERTPEAVTYFDVLAFVVAVSQIYYPLPFKNSADKLKDFVDLVTSISPQVVPKANRRKRVKSLPHFDRMKAM